MSFFQSHTFDVVNFLSALTLIGQLIALFLLVVLVKDVITKKESALSKWGEKHALKFMFIVAAVATCGSLFFSEIAGWTPCKDCWFQRIFIYPQVVLLGIALWKRDKKIALYILPMCVIGLWFSADHYFDQVEAALTPVAKESGINVLLKPCDASGISCADTQIHFAFGYITIPLMALTASLLNAVGSLFILRKNKF